MKRYLIIVLLISFLSISSVISPSIGEITDSIDIYTEDDETDFEKIITLDNDSDTTYVLEIYYYTIEGSFSYNVTNLNKGTILIVHFPTSYENAEKRGNVTDATPGMLVSPNSSIAYSSFQSYDCNDCVYGVPVLVDLNGSETAEFLVKFSAGNLNEVSDGLRIPINFEFVMAGIIFITILYRKLSVHKSIQYSSM